MRLPPDARLHADVGALLEAAGEASRDEVLEPILIHLRLLARWNDAYGLTRITEWPQVLDRHVRESLLPLRWIGEAPGRLLDVGSGNGFPALPILACRPRLAGVLLERSERKGLFLDAVIREAGWMERIRVDTTDAEAYVPGYEKVEETPGWVEPRSAADKGRKAGKSAAARRSRSGWPDGEVEAGTMSAADDSRKRLFDFVVTRATLPPDLFLRLATRWILPSGRVFLFAGDLSTGLTHDQSHAASGDQPVDSPAGIDPKKAPLQRIVSEQIRGRRASFLHVFRL